MSDEIHPPIARSDYVACPACNRQRFDEHTLTVDSTEELDILVCQHCGLVLIKGPRARSALIRTDTVPSVGITFIV